MRLALKPLYRYDGSICPVEPQLCNNGSLEWSRMVVIERQLVAEAPQCDRKRQPAKSQDAWPEHPTQ